jgi:hypothetical protein
MGSRADTLAVIGNPAESSRARSTAIVLTVAVVGVVVAFALLHNPPPPPAPPLGIAATPAPAPAQTPFPGAAPAVVAAPAQAPVAAAPPEALTPAWEGTIEGILRLNVSEGQMARMLINILPTLPEDGQIEAANHIANLLPDSDYGSLRPLLLNSSLPESVQSVFFTDLMNRDDPTKLNAFLDIAQVPNHPFQAEAVSDLQIYVGNDYGTDWPKWKTAVAQYLKTASQQ